MPVPDELYDLLEHIQSQLPKDLHKTYEEAADRALQHHSHKHGFWWWWEHQPQPQEPGAPALFLFVLGLIGGAALMYFFDPDHGAGRRAQLQGQVDQAAGRINETMKQMGDQFEDATHMQRSESSTQSDKALQARVYSEMGRYVADLGALNVTVHDGTVVLSGKILAREAQPLVERVRSMSGVRAVENRMEIHDATPNGAAPSGAAAS